MRKQKRIFFKLGAIVGDNLGLHGLLGFAESFNANFMCRFCKMDKTQRSLATEEDKLYLRTKESYKEDLELHDISRSGIKKRCIFNNLSDFHVIDNLSVDIMHDFLEGTCKFDMVAILKYCTIKMKFFSLLGLAERMKNYDWGLAESSNITPPIL